MKSTLFIEISELTARILLYNNADDMTHHIDITGGYGKRAIPLAIHYLEDGDILIGEDTLLYEVEEGSTYIESILQDDEAVVADYIYVIKNKVEELTPNLQLSNIIVVSGNKRFGSQALLDMYRRLDKETFLSLISIREAIAGWCYQEIENSKVKELNIGYLDYKFLNAFKIIQKSDTGLLNITEINQVFDLDLINKYYLNQLKSMHSIEDNQVTTHQLNQLYHNQKATIHKQQLNSKDINIYSSMVFPPVKLVLLAEDYNSFQTDWMKQFETQNGVSLLNKLKVVDKFIITGGYDSMNFVKQVALESGLNFDYEENLLLDGAYEFLKLSQSNINIIYKQTLDCVIGVFNNKEFYPLISEEVEFSDHYDVDLVLTDYQKELILYSLIDNKIKPIHTIEIKEPMKIQRVLLNIHINQNKEIEEVSYELRRL